MIFRLVLDAFCVLIILFGILSALKRGILVAIYNVVVTYLVVMIVLHIYPRFTDMVKARLPVLPEGFGDFLSVGVLFIGFMVIARLVRELIVFFFITAEPSGLERIFSLMLGAISGILSASMFMFWVYLAPWGEENLVESGRLSRYLYILPAEVYTFTTDTLLKPYLKAKFTPNPLVYLGDEKGEHFNKKK